MSVMLSIVGGGRAVAAVRVACVGDSITVGVGATKENGYPAVLARLLGSMGSVASFGDSGSTALRAPAESYWKTPAFGSSRASVSDVVVIMFGTNDSKRANWSAGKNVFETDYRALIGEYAGLASRPRIFVVLPPPALSDRFTVDGPVIEREILPIIRKIARDTGSGLVDVFAAFQPDPTKYFGAGDGSDLGDGVHPNDAGAQRIADTVFRALTANPSDGGAPAEAGADTVTPPRDGSLDSGDGRGGADRAGDTNVADLDALAPQTDGRQDPLSADGSLAPPLDGAAPLDAGEDPPFPPRDGPAAGCQCSAARAARPPTLALLAFAAALARRRRLTRSL
jgi:acyl-CoA thioesterase-1